MNRIVACAFLCFGASFACASDNDYLRQLVGQSSQDSLAIAQDQPAQLNTAQQRTRTKFQSPTSGAKYTGKRYPSKRPKLQHS